MHDALKRLLKEALPLMVGGSVMVSDEALENGGGDDRFMAEIRRKLADMIAHFLVDNKVLDGADESCFSMRPHPDLAATECTARLHVLTPQELETLMQKAFDAGRSEGRHGGIPSERYYGAPPWLEIEKPWVTPAKKEPMPPGLWAIEEAYMKRKKQDFP